MENHYFWTRGYLASNQDYFFSWSLRCTAICSVEAACGADEEEKKGEITGVDSRVSGSEPTAHQRPSLSKGRA